MWLRTIAYEYVELLKPVANELKQTCISLYDKGEYNKANDIAHKLNALIEQINGKKQVHLNYGKIYVGIRCAMENSAAIDKKLIA